MKPDVRVAVLLAAYGAVLVLWTVVIFVNAAGQVRWTAGLDFYQVGQLGDAFGSFSAIMAGAAAIFTGATYWATRAENARLRDEQTSREADAKFYRLLELRSRVVANVALLESDAHMDAKGLEALHLMSASLVSAVASSEDPVIGYAIGFHPYRHALSHYLRFTYHLVATVLETFPDEGDRYHYLCLLRSQMTNAEYVLLALTCAHGKGRGLFKAWVERYALLRNIDLHDRDQLGLDGLFAAGAFEWTAAVELEPVRPRRAHRPPREY